MKQNPTSRVFYFNARAHSEQHSLSASKPLLGLQEIHIQELITKGTHVCIKTHFGARQNTRYLRPAYIRYLVDFIKDLGGNPVVTESCGVGIPNGKGEYAGRATEAEYLQCAKEHGFSEDTMGCPVYMLDGEMGLNYIVQPLEDSLLFKEILVAERLKESQILIMASHFKGHKNGSFGGAIKNLGIGCVAKGGKAAAHFDEHMYISSKKCIEKCTKCIDNCPTEALSKKWEDGKIKIHRNKKKCRKCRICHGICPEQVFTSNRSNKIQLIEHFVDNACGVVKSFKSFNEKNQIIYINYLIDVTPNCDCSGISDLPIVPDLGVLISTDPVAIDQACIDLIHQTPPIPLSLGEETVQKFHLQPSGRGYEYFSWIHQSDDANTPDLRWNHQLAIAEQQGLGSRKYILQKMD